MPEASFFPWVLYGLPVQNLLHFLFYFRMIMKDYLFMIPMFYKLLFNLYFEEQSLLQMWQGLLIFFHTRNNDMITVYRGFIWKHNVHGLNAINKIYHLSSLSFKDWHWQKAFSRFHLWIYVSIERKTCENFSYDPDTCSTVHYSPCFQVTLYNVCCHFSMFCGYLYVLEIMSDVSMSHKELGRK